MKVTFGGKQGFTLIELLMVIAMIAVLLALLLPALARAKAIAYRATCAANLRGVGQSITMFAQDHQQSVPDTMLVWNDNSGHPQNYDAGPYWEGSMYSRHYFDLIDRYGASEKQFICPAAAADMAAPVRKLIGAFNGLESFDCYPGSFPQRTEAAVRLESRTLPAAPDYSAGDWALSYNFVEFQSYEYMGNDPNLAVSQPWMVNKLGQGATMGNAFDNNPPLMADATWVQPGGGPGGGPKVAFNHGQQWTVTGFSPAARGAMTAMFRGDVKENVLYCDDHVDYKAPEHYAYWNLGAHFFY